MLAGGLIGLLGDAALVVLVLGIAALAASGYAVGLREVSDPVDQGT
jgi:hypothetical protein